MTRLTSVPVSVGFNTPAQTAGPFDSPRAVRDVLVAPRHAATGAEAPCPLPTLLALATYRERDLPNLANPLSESAQYHQQRESLLASNDDRALYAALVSHSSVLSRTDEDDDFYERLTQRALDCAKAAGLLWTPLLDALASSSARYSHVPCLTALVTPEALASLDAAMAAITIPDCEVMLETFRTPEIRTLVAAHVPEMTERMARLLCSPDSDASLVLDHPTTTRAVADAILMARLEQMVQRNGRGVLEQRVPEAKPADITYSLLRDLQTIARRFGAFPEALRGVCYHIVHRTLEQHAAASAQAQSWWSAKGFPEVPDIPLDMPFVGMPTTPAFVDTRAALIVALDPALPTEIASALMRCARRREIHLAILANTHLDPAAHAAMVELFDQQRGSSWGNLQSTTDLLRIAPERLLRCYHSPDNGDIAGWVLEQPECPLDLARHYAANHFQFELVRSVLAGDARWRNDPTIRAKLVKSGTEEVLADLLEHQPSAEEFSILMPRYLERFPASAATLLEQRPIPEGAALDPKKLADVLTNPQLAGELRLRLVTILGQIPAAAVAASDPDAAPRGRRTQRATRRSPGTSGHP